jgi:flagellar motor switch protein FliG
MTTAIELRRREQALLNPAFDVAELGNLQGSTKAFLFLISLDEEIATRIISHLGDDELKLLRRASEETREVSSQTLLALHREFALRARGGAPTSLKGGSAYLRRLAGKALGEGRVAEVWTDRAARGGLVAELEKLTPPALLGLLDDESPQTLALILSQFDPTKAADVLAALPKEQRGEILYRMATLQAVPETTFKEIEAELSAELVALSEQPDKRAVGGVASAAAVMKMLKPEHLEGLLDQMQDADSQITDLIKRAMFTFEDLLRISGRGIQVLLKEIPSDQLLLALRTSSDDMKEKIFGNVSQRAATMLREELEMMGPVRLSDVETAQRTMIERALQLEAEGQIRIEREGSNDFV